MYDTSLLAFQMSKRLPPQTFSSIMYDYQKLTRKTDAKLRIQCVCVCTVHQSVIIHSTWRSSVYGTVDQLTGCVSLHCLRESLKLINKGK